MTIQPMEEVISKAKEVTSWEVKKYAHIVSPPENVAIFAYLQNNGNPDPSAKDIVAEAREYRWFVTAICGYRWIPSMDPDNLDACPICMDVAGMHMRNAGE